MTKVTRLGLSALLVVGGCGVGAFAGCSGDDAPVVVPVDTDTGPGDTGSDAGDTSVAETAGDSSKPDSVPETDGALPKPDRKITLMFAAPDMGPQFVCLGAWVPGTDGKADITKAPLQAQGPFGIPDTTAPDDVTKYKGFPFGATVPFPVADAAVKGALDSLAVVGYVLDTNPGKDGCKAAFDTVKASPGRLLSVAKGTIKTGESWAAILTGCNGAPTATGECGDGSKKLEFFSVKLDPADKGADKIGMQGLNLSLFPGASPYPPSFADVDLYIQPMNAAAAGDAGSSDALAEVEVASDGAAPGPTPAGAPILISPAITAANGLQYKDLLTTAIATAKIPGDINEALLVISKHTTAGTPYCSSAPPPGGSCLTSVTVPLKPFIGAAKSGDPSLKLAVGENLVVGFAGSVAGTPPKFRVFIANSKF